MLRNVCKTFSVIYLIAAVVEAGMYVVPLSAYLVQASLGIAHAEGSCSAELFLGYLTAATILPGCILSCIALILAALKKYETYRIVGLCAVILNALVSLMGHSLLVADANLIVCLLGSILALAAFLFLIVTAHPNRQRQDRPVPPA